ncbi:hypothetical protein B0T22DRAFT_468506 [Podospora appendiculata]|uniref:Uncharacterized protein n=1 Tax=Podospora appendiculata TaxID=314037 RepID=A0AAE0X2T0_9PEZI|nr:hypothetical protein B0T22DRAFT_468506 [Podospora appendiculata]
MSQFNHPVLNAPYNTPRPHPVLRACITVLACDLPTLPLWFILLPSPSAAAAVVCGVFLPLGVTLFCLRRVVGMLLAWMGQADDEDDEDNEPMEMFWRERALDFVCSVCVSYLALAGLLRGVDVDLWAGGR